MWSDVVRALGRVARGVALVVALVCALLPLYLIVTTSFKLGRDAFAMPPKWIFSPPTEHYAKVFSESRFVDTYWNSLVISFGSVGVAILVGLPAAYALTRYQFRGKGLMTQLFLGSRIFPQIAILIPLFVAFQWGQLHAAGTLVMLPVLIFALLVQRYIVRGLVSGALKQRASGVDIGHWSRTAVSVWRAGDR